MRNPNDPLPSNVNKYAKALGAVHSNYKTEPCRYLEREGKCPYDVACSYYHNEAERRMLTDELPDSLPEGAILPPMPKNMYKARKRRENLTYRARETNSEEKEEMPAPNTARTFSSTPFTVPQILQSMHQM